MEFGTCGWNIRQENEEIHEKLGLYHEKLGLYQKI